MSVVGAKFLHLCTTSQSTSWLYFYLIYMSSVDLPVGDLRLLTAEERPLHLLMLDQAHRYSTHHTSTCRLYWAHAGYYVTTNKEGVSTSFQTACPAQI